MAKINVGDRVRIKDRKDWPLPPGYRLANSEGTVVKVWGWEEVFEELKDYLFVQLDQITDEVNIATPLSYGGISNVLCFRVENLEKI